MNHRQKEVQQAFLNDEKAVLKQLEENYQNALMEIDDKIANLLGRDDANMQNVIYQVDYQKALRSQVQGILDQLHANEFTTVSEYLANAYNTGFIGTMYDIAGQGIPLIIPINQEQVVRAIQHETKLSDSLYEALGKDTKRLSKQIAGEISRGISNAATYEEMTRNIASFSNIPRNNAARIARTEAHRIQCQATADAQWKAKEKGADVVKQWDATMDGNTRDTHRMLDGQLRELEEPFEAGGWKVMQPGGFGDPGEDCNCRCALLQRARWALDESELDTLKERAAFHGLIVDDSKKYGHEKAKDFSDYKNKYSVAAKLEEHYNNALKIEPSITNDMKEIANKIDVDLYGLEYRIKSKESYLEKIQKNGYDYEVKDIIRYTFGTDDPNDYVPNVQSIVENLKQMGYNTIEVKNFWLNDSNPYNGINTTVIEHKGQKFEVQFHTKESFEAKQKMHTLYEKQRKLTDIYSPEYIDLTDQMFAIADSITIPEGIGGI